MPAPPPKLGMIPAKKNRRRFIMKKKTTAKKLTKKTGTKLAGRKPVKKLVATKRIYVSKSA
jgi:hypothetical protein